MAVIPCWCCGRDTEAAELSVLIPTALHAELERYAVACKQTYSAVVQEALSLLLLPPKKED